MSTLDAGGSDLEIQHWLNSLRRHAKLFAAVVITLTAVGIAVGSSKAPYYRATAEVLVSQVASFVDGSTPAELDMASELRFANGSEAGQLARAALGADDSASVKITTDAALETQVIAFAATADSPTRAASAANAYADGFIKAREARTKAQQGESVQRLEQAAAEVDKRIADLGAAADDDPRRLALNRQADTYRAALDQIDLNTILAGTSGAAVTTRAAAPLGKAGPSIPLHAGFAMFAGLFVAAGAVGIAEFRDSSVRDARAARAAAGGAPVLGVVRTSPARWWPFAQEREGKSGVVVLDEPSSHEAEAFRRLRTTITSGKGEPTRFIQVTSGSFEDGAGAVAANLATAFAQAGHDTVLVCIDGYTPRLPIEAAASAAGIQAAISGRVPVEDCLQYVTGVPNLRLLASDARRADPDALPGAAVASLFDTFCAAGGFVVLLSPPVLVSSSALEMATLVDGTILSVEPGGTGAAELARVADSFALVDARVLGVVLVD